jgi:hypothetical protein
MTFRPSGVSESLWRRRSALSISRFTNSAASSRFTYTVTLGRSGLRVSPLCLGAAELAHLDSLTKPTFGFPQNLQPLFPAIHNGGTMVNGFHAPPSAFVLEKTDRPY